MVTVDGYVQFSTRKSCGKGCVGVSLLLLEEVVSEVVIDIFLVGGAFSCDGLG